MVTASALTPPPIDTAPLPPPRVSDSGVRVLAGVPYAGLPGVRPLELDLWLPPATGTPVPVAVFLHGGGWRLGSRHSAGPAYSEPRSNPFETTAQAGIAVASVDYRLSGEATFPAQLDDVRSAVRWLRLRADDLGVDPHRIAVWGESAGGHLAELVGFSGHHRATDGDVEPGLAGPVQAVVAWYAPSDIAAVATDAGTDPWDPTTREAQLLGQPAAAVPALAEQASPLTHVTSDAPPTLLLHGRGDRLISYHQSVRLHDALRRAGVPVHLHLYEDADHMWRNTSAVAADAVRRTITFLREQFALDDPPLDHHG